MNSIEKIRDAEQKAEAIETEARKKADTVIEDAGIEVQKILERAKADGAAKLEAAIDDAKISAEKSSTEKRDKVLEDLKKLSVSVETKMSDAVALVKTKLIS
ncbi:MAG: hypothetical protein J6Q10_00815 [Clostridia bacterium]|nr:hypothetical protein [Clostridia bacterium]